MQRTKYGFLVPFDTTKRKKYNDKQRQEIARLKVLGLSTRKIAEKLDIPHGSIHYILREFNLVNSEAIRPSTKYFTRSELNYMYNLTDAQFDYARTAHPEFTEVNNGVVFLHIDYVYDYVLDNKGYKDRYENRTKDTK